MKKKKSAAPIIVGGGLLTLVTIAVNIGVALGENAFIINIGARGYKLLRNFTGITTGLVFAIYLICMIAYLIRVISEKAPAPKEEPEVKPEGMLSASGKLSDDYVMKQLVNQGLTKWKCLEKEVSGLTDQLILMNSYQDRLSKLLANNSAQALSDTEDILERIEQQILGNVRKVLNFMEILGTDDKQTVSEYIEVCIQDNKKLLDGTKDFLLCVTGFLNNQGTNGDADLQMVEDFKAILVGNIQEAYGSGTGQQNDHITLGL